MVTLKSTGEPVAVKRVTQKHIVVRLISRARIVEHVSKKKNIQEMFVQDDDLSGYTKPAI